MPNMAQTLLVGCWMLSPEEIARNLATVKAAIDNSCYGRSRSVGIGFRLQHLLPEWSEEGEVACKAEIFPGDLQFHHQRRLRHAAEQRVEWFARLEIETAHRRYKSTRRDPPVAGLGV